MPEKIDQHESRNLPFLRIFRESTAGFRREQDDMQHHVVVGRVTIMMMLRPCLRVKMHLDGVSDRFFPDNQSRSVEIPVRKGDSSGLVIGSR